MDILLGVPLALLIGVAPMVAYALVLWWFDRYEKEPPGLLVAAFLWGAVPAIVFSLIIELLLDVPVSYLVAPASTALIGTAVVAPIVEELFKGAALLLLLLFFRKEIDSPLDGIIYGGLVGFGFAAVENTFYFLGTLAQSGLGALLPLAALRAVAFGLNHALFTGMTGLGIALARTGPTRSVRVGAPVLGLSLGIVAHIVHNAGVTVGAGMVWPCLIALVSDWAGVALLLAVIMGSLVQERRWIIRYLADEVVLGTLSENAYETVSSYTRRVAARGEALSKGDLRRWRSLGRYHRLATELAFSKRRLSRFPDAADAQAPVQELQGQVAELGATLA